MEDENQTSRLEAFSDGVFSIAITLLAFNLKIPRPADLSPGQSLRAALLAQWPIYLAYLTSFLTILVMWMNHHRLFKLIRKINRPLIFLNGLLLMFITLLPVSTTLLATYFEDSQVQTAAIVYSGNFFLIALSFNVVWRYAYWRHRLLGAHIDLNQARLLHKQYAFGPVFYLVALIVSFWSMIASFGICMALAIFFALPPPRIAGTSR